MGGWKAVPPTVYAVTWEDSQVVKVGFSSRQRWRRFELRGAGLVMLRQFDQHDDAFDYEERLHSVLRSTAEPAFLSSLESVAFLGADGDGWAECYAMRTRCLKQCIRICDCMCERNA